MPARLLRCVGGPSEDRYIEVPGGIEELPIIDPIRDPTPDNIRSAKATLYTVHVLKTPDGEIEFLAPGGWSTGMALRRRLT